MRNIPADNAQIPIPAFSRVGNLDGRPDCVDGGAHL